MIQLAKIEDLPDIMLVFNYARRFMFQHNNLTQWNATYLSQELMIKDIEQQSCYVFKEMRADC